MAKTTKTTTEATAPKANKAQANGKPEKKGLNKPQTRVLMYLVKAGSPKTRKEIAAGAKVDQAFLTENIGSNNIEIRKANDEKYWPCLLTLGFVKSEDGEDPATGRVTTIYTVSAAGRKAAEKLSK